MNPLELREAVSFARSDKCHPTHVLCVGCYLQVNGCPLCRFSPYHEVDVDGTHLIRHVKNQKNPSMSISYIKSILNVKRLAT